MHLPADSCGASYIYMGRYTMDRNKYGELGLGHGSSQSVAVPTPIHSLSGIVKVACGLHHSAAIDGEPTHYVLTHLYVCRGRLWFGGIVNILSSISFC